MALLGVSLSYCFKKNSLAIGEVKETYDERTCNLKYSKKSTIQWQEHNLKDLEERTFLVSKVEFVSTRTSTAKVSQSAKKYTFGMRNYCTHFHLNSQLATEPNKSLPSDNPSSQPLNSSPIQRDAETVGLLLMLFSC